MPRTITGQPAASHPRHVDVETAGARTGRSRARGATGEATRLAVSRLHAVFYRSVLFPNLIAD